MARFMICAALQDTQDHEPFDAAMATVGLHRVVQADDGTAYRLLPTQYWGEGEASAEQVLELVKTVAAALGHTAAITVSEVSQIWWNGLEVAEPGDASGRTGAAASQP